MKWRCTQVILQSSRRETQASNSVA